MLVEARAELGRGERTGLAELYIALVRAQSGEAPSGQAEPSLPTFLNCPWGAGETLSKNLLHAKLWAKHFIYHQGPLRETIGLPILQKRKLRLRE